MNKKAFNVKSYISVSGLFIMNYYKIVLSIVIS